MVWMFNEFWEEVVAILEASSLAVYKRQHNDMQHTLSAVVISVWHLYEYITERLDKIRMWLFHQVSGYVSLKINM